MIVLLENRFQRAIYYPEQCLFANLVLRAHYGEEFRAGCDLILAMALELRPYLWLTDNRFMGVLPSDDLAWLAEDYMPRFAKLPVNRSAIVQSVDVMSHLALLDMLTSATPHITWQERIFDSYDEAWNWLMKVASTDQETRTLLSLETAVQAVEQPPYDVAGLSEEFTLCISELPASQSAVVGE